MKQNYTEVAVGVIFGNDRKVLLAQRPCGKSFEGYWEFPGGKKELDEDIRSKARMFRLLQGDVGSGKTILAFISAANIGDNMLCEAILIHKGRTTQVWDAEFINESNKSPKMPTIRTNKPKIK